MPELAEKQTPYGGSVKVAVLLLMFVQLTVSITTPALGAIMKAFPDLDPVVIKQIATLPPLLLIFFSLAVAPLARVMGKKTILLTACTLIFAGGIAPAFGGGMDFILFSRVVFGAGYGLIFPLCPALIVDLFSGAERDTLMGYKSATGALAGVIYQTVGGLLAAVYWRYAFLGFLLALPFIVFAMVKIPEPEKKEGSLPVGNRPEQRGLPGNTWGVILLTAVAIMFFSSFMTNMAIVMVAYDIGTSAHAGLVMTIFTAGMFVGGSFYAQIAQRCKHFTIVIPFVLMAVALGVLASSNVFMIYGLAAFLFGCGFGVYNPYFILKVADTAGAAATMAISVYASGQGLGQFLQPYFFKWATACLGMNGEKAPWVIAACVLGAAAIMLILGAAMKEKEGGSRG